VRPRDGAPPVDLIDGDRLCDLLKDYELGVRLTIRQIEDVEVVLEFFVEI
jgi:restriction system protein